MEAKNCLDGGPEKDDTSKHFLKPPANLLVLEGDCLDASGDASELESYLVILCRSCESCHYINNFISISNGVI